MIQKLNREAQAFGKSFQKEYNERIPPYMNTYRGMALHNPFCGEAAWKNPAAWNGFYQLGKVYAMDATMVKTQLTAIRRKYNISATSADKKDARHDLLGWFNKAVLTDTEFWQDQTGGNQVPRQGVWHCPLPPLY